MTTSSEYAFPIFISSTDYNLIDLRAELARYLSELGYRPVLSSSEGFPDNSPNLEPWESCLPVLENCFVTVLVIDRKYGKSFDWHHFKEIFGDRKVSPTHAEYIYAHQKGKRLLVFIRKDIFLYYQNYRATLKRMGNKEKTKKLLKKTLPDGIDFEVLEFIEEVKTTKPIPWINTFENVTSIKTEIQKKMLNELAEIFLIKSKNLQTVVCAFSEVIDSLPTQKREEILHSIGPTRDLLKAVEEQTAIIKELKMKEEVLKDEVRSAKEKADKKQITKEKADKEIRKLDFEIQKLRSKIDKYKENSTSLLMSDASLLSGSTATSGVNYGNILIKPMGLLSSTSGVNYSPANQLGLLNLPTTCDKCEVEITNYFTTKKCMKCKKILCNLCWPYGVSINSLICPDCLSTPEESSEQED